MKAVTFLEYIRGTLTLKRIAPVPNPEIKTDEEFRARVFTLADFYNKPFKPEQITEYFEGWEEITPAKYDLAFKPKDDNIRIKILFGWGGMRVMNHNLDIDCDYKIPKTIDTFKSFLEEQCGIELTFNKTTAERLK